ncbi:MAG: class I tRNA ligase family protein, partial [Pseudomonadota bacterium]|nr:class I tRNA ligase family protein [Pseudomonadota bacterium]
EWTDAGVDGAWRYLNRLWRMVAEAELPERGKPMPKDLGDRAQKTRRIIHRSIVEVSHAFERFHFNGAVARIRELSNALEALDTKDTGEAWVLREGLETLTQLLGPMLPHIAEEMWETLGFKTLLTGTTWPKPEDSLLIETTVTIAVQVNGKLRARLTVPRDLPTRDVEAVALANENVVRAMNGGAAKKIIVVPNKIVNVVA